MLLLAVGGKFLILSLLFLIDLVFHFSDSVLNQLEVENSLFGIMEWWQIGLVAKNPLVNMFFLPEKPT